jgi:DNA repair exonuclease SbcCD ATPase subunit
MKKTLKNTARISSTDRLEELLAETEAELEAIEPKIEKLEKQLEKLKELKLAKQKLITLKLSIKSILNNYGKSEVVSSLLSTSENLEKPFSSAGLQKNLSIHSKLSQTSSHQSSTLENQTFIPERAFAEVDTVLRKKTSINYELFRAIVFNGGQATTEQIKQYLLEHDIRQPANGQGFENVELTDISSRINYLVRKGLVAPDGRGRFISKLGWTQPETV